MALAVKNQNAPTIR